MYDDHRYPKNRDLAWSYSDLPAIGSRTAVALLLVIALVAAATWKATSQDIDDGFTSFRPDVSLFPEPPVAAAVTTAGTGAPRSWPGSPEPCPYPRPRSSSFSQGWQTVRHDWTEDGTPKSWVISERTSGFTDLAEFDDYLRGYRDQVTYCGWYYDDDLSRGGHNARLVDLEGLPSGAFAFEISAAPANADYPEDYGPSNPDDFRAFGAVLPGRQRGHVMLLSWVGWGVDVPTDEFVITANALLDAADNAPDTGKFVRRPTSGARELYRSGPEFVGYSDVDGVVPTLPDSSVESSRDDPNMRFDFLTADGCPGENLTDDLARWPDSWDETTWDKITSTTASASRSVIIATARPESEPNYRYVADRLRRATGQPCIDSGQPNELVIEPIQMTGLPDGAVVAVWHQADNALTAVITDDDSHTVMIVAWQELPGPVPSDEFANVVSQAWDRFAANNPAVT